MTMYVIIMLDPTDENKTNTKHRSEIINLIQSYFKIMSDCDEEAFANIWHDKAQRVSIGNSNEIMVFSKDNIIEFSLRGLKNAIETIPGFFVRNEIIEISHIEILDVIATVEVKWHMIMPENRGEHTSCFHLAIENGKWNILNLLDRGIEKQL